MPNLFICNKYAQWYCNIVNKAQSESRSKGGDVYYENHHFIPSALGGSDCKENLVLLTAREHFIAHWLLYKIYSGEARYKMSHAWNRMCSSNEYHERYNSHNFERARKAHAKSIGEFRTGSKHSDVSRAKMSESAKGRTAWNKGKSFTKEARAKMKRARGNQSRSIKSYKVVDPIGNEYMVLKGGIRNFWREKFNSALPNAFHSISGDYAKGMRGKWKGWQVFVL